MVLLGFEPRSPALQTVVLPLNYRTNPHGRDSPLPLRADPGDSGVHGGAFGGSSAVGPLNHSNAASALYSSQLPGFGAHGHGALGGGGGASSAVERPLGSLQPGRFGPT